MNIRTYTTRSQFTATRRLERCDPQDCISIVPLCGQPIELRRCFTYTDLEQAIVLNIQLTPCSRVFFEKLIVAQPLKKLPAYYGTGRFITMFTRNPPLVPVRRRWIQSTQHSISLISILISFHLRPDLPCGLLQGFLQNLCMHLCPMRATWPVCFILLDAIMLIIFYEDFWENYLDLRGMK
jgi:hypothetical protein